MVACECHRLEVGGSIPSIATNKKKEMARRIIAKQQTTLHYCGECGHGTPDMKFENLSVDGKPTLVSCPFQPYKMVVCERACDHFKLKD